MLKDLINLLFRKPATASPVPVSTVPPAPVPVKAAASPVPVYPPVDTGIPVNTIDEILDTQKDLLLRLRRLAGGTDATYEKYYFKIVCNLVEYIQLLPASQKSHHNGAGGLFRLCLEVAFFSLQSSEGFTFASNDGVEDRREKEPRWRYGTFIAALCSELYRVISEMVVTDIDGNVWPKYLKSLTTWTADNQLDRYFVSWHKAHNVQTAVNGRADVAIIMKTILPDYALQYLEDAQSEILPIVFAVASGSSHPTDNLIAKIVSDTKSKIVKRDEATRKERYGHLTIGNHLEPYLLDAMRTLIAEKVWLLNLPKSRLWFAKEGLFVIWKNGSKEIIEQVTRAGIAGVPRDANTLAAMLCESRICVRNNQDMFWMVKPEDSDAYYQCMKIADPLSVLEDINIPFAEITIQTLEPAKGGTKSDRVIGASTSLEPLRAEAPKVTVTKVEEVVPVKALEEPKKPAARKKAEPVSPQRDLLESLESGSDRQTESTEEVKELVTVDQGSHEHISESAKVSQVEAVTGESKSVKAQVPETEKAELRTVEKPREEQNDEEAEIAPVAAAIENYSDLLSERARKILRPEIAEVVGKMIHDFRSDKYKDQIFVTGTNGIAFELPQIQRYGIATDKIIGLFHSNSWIETPPENPEKKLVKATNPKGKQTNCIVIKFASAQLLGFISDDT